MRTGTPSREVPTGRHHGIKHTDMVITHVVAASLIQMAYMVSVKRTSLLFGVLLGALLFKETHIGQRLAGAAIMLAGFAMVALFSQATN